MRIVVALESSVIPKIIKGVAAMKAKKNGMSMWGLKPSTRSMITMNAVTIPGNSSATNIKSIPSGFDPFVVCVTGSRLRSSFNDLFWLILIFNEPTKRVASSLDIV